MSRDVILVPGLWAPAVTMSLLGARLRAEGFTPHLFGYSGRGPFEASVERLADFGRRVTGGRPAHFAGHSLGGLLVLQTLNRHAELPVATALLLGAPVRGCLSARKLAHARVGRWMLGACQGLWREEEVAWRRDAPLGVIAGTVPLGLGRALGRLPGENDGVVCLEETSVRGMTARALVPLGHSVIIVSSRVARLAARFMRDGKFE